MSDTVTLRIVPSFRDISLEDWSRLEGTSRLTGGEYHPFLSHAFLSSL